MGGQACVFYGGAEFSGFNPFRVHTPRVFCTVKHVSQLAIIASFAMLDCSCMIACGPPSGERIVDIGLLNPGTNSYRVFVEQFGEHETTANFTNGYTTVAIPGMRKSRTSIGGIITLSKTAQETESVLRIANEKFYVKSIRLDDLLRCPRDFGGNYMVDLKR